MKFILSELKRRQVFRVAAVLGFPLAWPLRSHPAYERLLQLAGQPL